MQSLPEEIFLSVLYYEEDGQWVAHALEMDICGCGVNREDAAEELEELVNTQISFAAYMKDPSLIFKRAEQERFDQFQAAAVSELRRAFAEFVNEELGEPEPWPTSESRQSFTASSMPLPHPTAIRERMGLFQVANA